MNRRNYQRELDRIIQKQGEALPRVLLHACCAPCASSVLEYLCKHFRVTLLWYNPNLHPEAEFEKRYEALVKLLEDMGLSSQVEILREEWRARDYYEGVKGLERGPEGGRRCSECFRLRLLETAKQAKAGNFDYFCTTLSLSRHKDAVLINDLGESLSREFGVSWLPSDFKKRNGENRSIELCEEYKVYRQLYCGCSFSLQRREETGKAMEEKLKNEQ